MTKEEDEEKILLSSLGVTSANVEDVERKILSEAKEEDPNSKKQEKNESSKTQNKLLNKLHAINLEIEAVSSGLKKGKSNNSNNEQKKEEKEKDKDEGKIKNSKNLQKALVIDRLKSLKRTKLQIEQQLNESGAGPSKRENIKQKELTIQNLVKEKPKKGKGVLKNEVKQGKGVLKNEVKKSGTDAKKPMKIVSYQEDTEFDAILDAAASGFMETERERLVRKGILTPFHSLKGFEKRVKLKPTKPDNPSSVRQNASINPIDPLEAESIARLNKSMAEIARSRPSTKLMDANQLPALDPPAAPFQRIRNPLKRPVSPGRKKEKKSKRKRPLPDIKWREKIIEGVSDEEKDDEEEETSCMDSDAESEPDIILEGGLNIPSKIYNQLFDYQKIGVQWLWELHCQKAGGIIGDEMGLGKTIQVLSFLASLHHSDLYKPSIVICPVTLLRQWKREAEKWYPEFRVEILHDSANVGTSRKVQESEESEIDDSDEDFESEKKKPRGFRRNPKKWDELIKRVLDSDSGLLITTYEQIRLLGEKLIDVNWGYAILDEGHRIRNPNAEITLICKQFRTMHRIIMTGAPIQNKLSELWSLFDFVFPGKLGVLPVFEAEFSVPITVGGYVNANPLQVSTAYRCAVVLRDLIMPYLLRRMKADVDAQLPKKTEHVLFCSLTPEQRSIYRSFLASSEVEQIFDGRRNSLSGIDVLKKICNHPDLLERESSERNPDYGNFERSGKMKVVEQVLGVWKEQGHRVLFFAQTQQMLDIMENFMNLKGYVYRRMDGYTPVKQRMALMDEFNNSNEVFVFILTTRVGGLGTNLTGANRVIIYDPDWNPSTDMQARERAWRIGQKKDVTVYRLITRGTIEEKIYQRQIYKHFLTNKVLKDPRQKRVFKARDMKDLFTLQDEVGTTETSNIFGQLSEDVNVGVESEKSGKKENGNNKLSDRGKEKVKEEEEREKVDGETNILKSLFDAHGIHSAMNHDAILNVNEDQKVRMEKEAAQVAQRATEALRQSRMDRAREDFAVPTWTGRAGAAGAPPSVRRRFGSTANPVHRAARPPSPSLEPSRLTVGVNGSRRALPSSEVVRRIQGTRASAVFDAMEADLAPARLASPEASRSRVVMNALPAAGTARVNGNNNRRGLSSSEILSRISGTRASTVFDAMETDSVHARLASPEASRSRALTALPAGRDLSSDSSEGSRRRVRTALPVGSTENNRGANRGDVSSESSGDSRSRVLMALPVHGAHASAVSDAMETDFVSARLASPDVSTSRVMSALPVGARVASAVPDAI